MRQDDVIEALRDLADRIERGSIDESVVCVIDGGDDPALYLLGADIVTALVRAEQYLEKVIGDMPAVAGGLH